MFKKILLTVSMFSLLVLPVAVSAQDGFQNTVSPFAGTSSGDLLPAITSIVNALLTLAAIVAVIFVIIGGVRYIISQGDEDAVTAAKETVMYAIIGVIVIALSAVLVNFFLQNI